MNLVRPVQLSFEIGIHTKDIELLYKLKSAPKGDDSRLRPRIFFWRSW